ncbi:MAG: hypothetical protein ACRDWI_07615 [Jiangellaceae bacterium]
MDQRRGWHVELAGQLPDVDDGDPIEELDEVLRRGLAAGAVSEADRALLLDLAYAANSLGRGARGRAGLSHSDGRGVGKPGSQPVGTNDPASRC